MTSRLGTAGRRAAAAIATLLIVAIPALGADLRPFGPPTTPYTADSRMVADGKVIEARLSAAGVHERREMTIKGKRQALIIDHQRGSALMLFLNERMAMDVPVEAALGPAIGRSLRWEMTALGPETIGGVPTTRHRVVGRHASGIGVEGTIWLTAQAIPLRARLTVNAQGRRYEVSQELRNLRLGPVDAGLFRAPAGFSRVTIDGGARRR